MKIVNTKPDISEFIGTWEADSFSYQLIKEEYSDCQKPVKMKINKSGEFYGLNFPDMISIGSGHSIRKEFKNCEGRWELDSLNGYWNLGVRFEPCELFKNGCLTSYNLYKFNGELVIWIFLGDPDEARRLMFRKID